MINGFSNSVHGLNDFGDENVVVRDEDHGRESPLVREVLPQPVRVDPANSKQVGQSRNKVLIGPRPGAAGNSLGLQATLETNSVSAGQ